MASRLGNFGLAIVPNNQLKRYNMADEMIKEKIYCTGGNNDAPWLAAMMNNKRDCDPMAMAAMANGGMGGQWNNPFIYLVWMMFAQRMWGNGWDTNGQNAQNVELQNQIQSLRSQIAENQNSGLIMDAIKGNGCAINQLASNLNCDFNTLNSAICDVRGGIDRLSGAVGMSAERVINAINMGNLNLVQQLKDCCCQTQQNIIKMGYENQLGQKDIINAMQSGFDRTNTGIERGFSAIGYQMATDKCDILRGAENNTQRIIDVLNNHWQSDLQQRYNDARLELSQQRQNATLIAALKTTTTTT